MKKIIAHKFYLKHTQNGIVFIFTIFLLLIISILTITFFYLQFLEVDLIADETEYIQAFYLAEAGLEQGENEFRKNTRTIIGYIQDKYSNPNYNDAELTCYELYNLYEQDNYTHIDMYEDIASNKQGAFCYGYKLDSNIPVDSNISLIDSNIIITITGKGWVNEESEPAIESTTERRENRREIERSFRRRPFGVFSDFPDEDINNIVKLLKNPIVTSRLEPNEIEKITIYTVDIEGHKTNVSKGQKRLLTFNEMSIGQRNAYNEFANRTKSKIAKARIFDLDNPRNRNRFLLWGEDSFDRYNSPWLVGETISEDNSEFKYTESRIKPEKLTIIKPSMTIKRNKRFTLRHGPLPYFFEKLTLEENSILNTDGPVTIYVKRLILEDKAKLMGGPGTDPDKASPNDLIILAECWPGSSCSKADDGIHLGSRAKICGHIFAPNLKVYLCKGYMGGNTRVYGSILTYQLVTSRCDAGASFGPIWVIYQEYLEEDINPIPDSWREVRNP